MTTSIDTTNSYSDVVINSTNPSVIYAAIGTSNGSTSNGIYQSTNGGNSWSQPLSNYMSGSSVGRISLAISPTNPSVIYAAVADPVTGALLALQESTDGGNNWIDRTSGTPNFPGKQGADDLSLAVDPTLSTTVYVGGSALLVGNQNVGSVYVSTDSGANWRSIASDNNGVGVHPDIHTLVFDANKNLLLGSDGGIYRKDSDPNDASGFVWTDLNSNLNTLQFYSIALNPTNANQALGGSQDNGTALYTGPSTWSQVISGDGGIVRYNPQNSNLVYATTPLGDSGAANVFRVSTDGGNTWNPQTTGLHFDTEPSNFVPPLAVDPNDGSQIAVGSNELYLGKTNSSGAVTWNEVTTVGNNNWNPNKSNIDTIALGGDGKTIYASVGGQFASSSQIFVSSRQWRNLDRTLFAFRQRSGESDHCRSHKCANRLRCGQHVHQWTGPCFQDHRWRRKLDRHQWQLTEPANLDPPTRLRAECALCWQR